MEWVRGEIVGHGSFGTVNLARRINQNPQFPPLMAVKSCGSSHSVSLTNEKAILEELSDCPEIIRCFGGDSSVENGEKLCNLLLEYASGGNLANKIRSSGERRLPECDVRRYTKSVLKGIHYIHENGFVHCDIKLQNILLCSSDQAKIADFGLAKRAGERTGHDIRGTPLYMSPEMVVGGEQESPADVWALGCLLAEMVTGAPAWKIPSGSDIFGLLMRIGVGDEVPEIPEKLSAEGRDFLGKCFCKDSRKRWTAEMLLNHPFIVNQTTTTTVPLDQESCGEEDCTTSASPRGPFDFPNWELGQSSSDSSETITSLTSSPVKPSTCSPAERLRRLVNDQRPNWSVADSWVRLR